MSDAHRHNLVGMPPTRLPEDPAAAQVVVEGVLRGMYRLRRAEVRGAELTVQLLGSGPLLGEVLRCLLYTSPSPRDRTRSRMPSSA